MGPLLPIPPIQMIVSKKARRCRHDILATCTGATPRSGLSGKMAISFGLTIWDEALPVPAPTPSTTCSSQVPCETLNSVIQIIDPLARVTYQALTLITKKPRKNTLQNRGVLFSLLCGAYLLEQLVDQAVVAPREGKATGLARWVQEICKLRFGCKRAQANSK